MTIDVETAQKDLAFLKALVSEGPRAQSNTGLIFCVAGLAYGVACLIYAAQSTFGFTMPGLVWLLLSIAPTAIIFVPIGYVVWRERKVGEQGIGTRAINAAYGSAGLANLFIAITYGYVALTQKSMLIWLLYPVAICGFQGAVWYVAWMIRRRAWLGFMSIGWFCVTLLLGYLIREVSLYLWVLGAALILLMGGGGYGMMRHARHGDM